MKKSEVNIIIDLLDREIDNYKSVRDRVSKKEYWQERIDELERIKNSLNQNKDGKEKSKTQSN